MRKSQTSLKGLVRMGILFGDGLRQRHCMTSGAGAHNDRREQESCARPATHDSPADRVICMAVDSAAMAETQLQPSFALGLGLTNECNLACAFCYRDPTRTDSLTLDQVRRAVESVPLRSVNLGTGENGMHPEFPAILAYLRRQPLKLTMTSNGYSVQVLPDEDLTAFHEIEFSLDYPNEREQDAQRGAGNWALTHEQAARCRNL